jgi:group I intron endonuclease
LEIENKIIGVYCILNIVNNKVYIGQSFDIATRFKRHIQSLNNNKHHNTYLQRAWNKYGEENFEFIILEETILNNLNEKEKYYMDEIFESRNYKNGYNSREAGSNGKHSLEARIKMSISSKGQITTEETKEILRQKLSGKNNPMFGKKGELSPFYGKHHTKEAKLKISEANKGNVVSEETRKKISDSLKGKMSGEDNPFYGKQHSEETKDKLIKVK